MQLSILTLIGFTLTTLCTSLCPMGMDMMAMADGDMQMMGEEMAQTQQQKTPCKKCDKKTEEVAAVTTLTVKIQTPAHSLLSVMRVTSHYDVANLQQSIKLVHAYTRPPPLARSLIGTVILRT